MTQKVIKSYVFGEKNSEKEIKFLILQFNVILLALVKGMKKNKLN